MTRIEVTPLWSRLTFFSIQNKFNNPIVFALLTFFFHLSWGLSGSWKRTIFNLLHHILIIVVAMVLNIIPGIGTICYMVIAWGFTICHIVEGYFIGDKLKKGGYVYDHDFVWPIFTKYIAKYTGLAWVVKKYVWGNAQLIPEGEQKSDQPAEGGETTAPVTTEETIEEPAGEQV